jgi:hypothetical protein
MNGIHGVTGSIPVSSTYSSNILRDRYERVTRSGSIPIVQPDPLAPVDDPLYPFEENRARRSAWEWCTSKVAAGVPGLGVVEQENRPARSSRLMSVVLREGRCGDRALGAEAGWQTYV